MLLTSLKSLYFTGQGCKSTHTLLATGHQNRSEQWLAGVDWHSASPVCVVVEVDGVKKCVYSYRMNTQSTQTGEVKQLEGVWSQVKK